MNEPRAGGLARGALFMTLAAVAFSLMGACVKTATETLPSTVVVFFRNAIALAILAPWLLRGGLAGLATKDVPGHLLRGIGGLLSMTCFFYALSRLKLADAMLLNQSMPLFLPLAAFAVIGEPIPKGLWRVLFLGFLGIAFIVKPGASFLTPGVPHETWAAILGLASAVLAALAQTGVRRLARTEPVTRIVFYFSLIATVGSALPLVKTWRTPQGREWAVLVLTGIFATIGQLLLTRAYAQAPAAQIGPFVYSGVVFAGLLDWAVWHLLPDAFFVLGAVLVLLAAVLALRLSRLPVEAQPV